MNYPGVTASGTIVRIGPDGAIKKIACLRVDRPISPNEAQFDEAWMDGLTSKIATLLRDGNWDSAEVHRE